MLRERFNPPSPIAWFFFLLGFGVTIGLGFWQMDRMKWKEHIIHELAEARKKPPLATLPTEESELAALQFLPVRLKGTWREDVEFHIAPRYLNDQFGYALITPLTLADGRTVLVNRGWIPAAKKDKKTRPESRVKGKATITGMVRIGAERSFFTPASQPDKNIWFGRDIDEMAAYARIHRVVPVMVDIVSPPLPSKPEGKDKKFSIAAANAPQKPAVTQLPIPSDGDIRLRNDHMGYIFTWFGLAAGMLLVFVTYHIRRPGKKKRRR